MNLDEFNLCGNGICYNIFHYTWLEDPLLKRVISLNIPHTIKFHLGKIRYWYYSQDGRIYRKDKKHQTIQEIQELYKYISNQITSLIRFHRSETDSQKILAVYYEGDNEIFLNYEQIQMFLQKIDHTFSGVFQKFIQTKYTYDQIIKTTWSQHFQLSEVLEGNQDQPNVGIYLNIQDQVSQIKGQTMIKPLKSRPLLFSQLSNEIDTKMKELQTHVNNINQKQYLKQAEAFFKINQNNQLYLIGLRNILMDGLYVQISSSENLKQSVQKNFLEKKIKICRVCKQKPATAGLFIKEIIQSDEVRKSRNKQYQHQQSKEISPLKKIPIQLRKAFPRMKLQDYEELQKNPILINSEIKLCEDCWSETIQVSRYKETIDGLAQFYRTNEQQHKSKTFFKLRKSNSESFKISNHRDKLQKTIIINSDWEDENKKSQFLYLPQMKVNSILQSQLSPMRQQHLKRDDIRREKTKAEKLPIFLSSQITSTQFLSNQPSIFEKSENTLIISDQKNNLSKLKPYCS